MRAEDATPSAADRADAVQEPSRRPPIPIAFACGLAMGCADAVPGVSGGTIALILGIYERFIAALAAVMGMVAHPLDAARRSLGLSALLFLVPLGVGLGTALVTAILLLVGDKPEVAEDAATMTARLAEAPGLLINPATAPYVFAAFFGLVLVSVPEPWLRRATRRPVDWIFAALGAAAAAVLSLLPSAGASPNPPMLVVAGAVAISVMLLPGISGSLALLVLGLYQPVAGMLHPFDPAIVWFLLGIGVGLALFVPALRWLLARCHDRTMAALSGLMAGSLVALWPWKPHYFPEAIGLLGPMRPALPDERWPLVAAVAMASAAAIGTLSVIARRRGR